MKNKSEFLECEKKYVFYMLMLIAGYYGVYTFTLKGGVFCNAQTANFVCFAMSVGTGDIKKVLYYLIPISAYLCGAIFSEILPNPVKRSISLRWETVLMLIEIAAVLFIGFLPDSAPVQISQITVNFICSMQYNTFRQAQGTPVATTFCTNHIRQVGVQLVKIIKHGRAENKERFLVHFSMLVSFISGGIICAVLCPLLSGKTILVTIIPLLILFFDFLYADKVKENERIEEKPRGH